MMKSHKKLFSFVLVFSRYENYHDELNINKKETIMIWYANMSFYEYYIHKKSNF